MGSNRLAIWLWYRGSRFWGFQSQPAHPTVQRVLTDAFAKLNAEIAFCGAGRTDKGVHARMQILSVRARPEVSAEMLFDGLTRNLPQDVGICAAVPSLRQFHAQWSCTGKEYRYRLDLGNSSRNRSWADLSWRLADDPRLGGRKVELDLLERFLRRCVGTRDFSSFHAKSSVRKQRQLRRASLHDLGDGLFEVRVVGDSFARYQVRYVIGSCAAAASGLLAAEQLESAIEHSTPIPGLRAPPEGLVLWEVFYAEEVDPFDARVRGSAPCLPREPPFHLD